MYVFIHNFFFSFSSGSVVSNCLFFIILERYETRTHVHEMSGKTKKKFFFKTLDQTQTEKVDGESGKITRSFQNNQNW